MDIRQHMKNKWLKRVLILGIIICYMALLTVVSYVQGPVRYKTHMGDPLLSPENFSIFVGNMPNGQESLYMDNVQAGSPMGYSAPLSLRSMDRVRIKFLVECPAECEGGVLHVDLQAYGYDNDEQEFLLTLKQGVNMADFSLDPGADPPQDVLLRIFTLDRAKYGVQNLQVYPETVLPQIPQGMIPIVIAAFAILLATIIFWVNSWKHSEEDK